MYQVGFGDCFLVTVEYGDPDSSRRAERHVLFDYGSTRSPRNTKKSRISDVAKLIAEHTHGQLDIVVVTHRHKDHLSGFGDDTAKRAGRLTLNPIKHVDPVGTLLVPAVLSLSGLGAYGWAKP